MIETTREPKQSMISRAHEPDRRPFVTRCSLLVTSLFGFVAVFGIAHLLLVHITKPSGYVFFGTLAVVSLLGLALLYGFARDRRAVLVRFGFGALMCACAVPFIYLARFAPESARPTVRNLIGLPFFVLALVGPGPFRRTRTGTTGV